METGSKAYVLRKYRDAKCVEVAAQDLGRMSKPAGFVVRTSNGCGGWCHAEPMLTQDEAWAAAASRIAKGGK